MVSLFDLLISCRTDIYRVETVVLCRWEENRKVSWFPARILKHLIPGQPDRGSSVADAMAGPIHFLATYLDPRFFMFEPFVCHAELPMKLQQVSAHAANIFQHAPIATVTV